MDSIPTVGGTGQKRGEHDYHLGRAMKVSLHFTKLVAVAARHRGTYHTLEGNLNPSADRLPHGHPMKSFRVTIQNAGMLVIAAIAATLISACQPKIDWRWRQFFRTGGRPR
ncbi:MAG: hypothetical protein IVW54_02225 [Candidatus Binataceae bacterium]|nr:hypothetical protein [Candidatus Binataceae bacterium]